MSAKHVGPERGRALPLSTTAARGMTRAASRDLTGQSSATLQPMRSLPTAPLAAGCLIVGYAVAAGSGSRPLGGIVLLVGAVPCVRAWTLRRGPRTATVLTGVGLGALILSHLVALATGAWPAVLLSATVMGAAAWIYADTPAARQHDARVTAL